MLFFLLLFVSLLPRSTADPSFGSFKLEKSGTEPKNIYKTSPLETVQVFLVHPNDGSENAGGIATLMY